LHRLGTQKVKITVCLSLAGVEDTTFRPAVHCQLAPAGYRRQQHEEGVGPESPQRDRTLREALSTSDGFAQELINGIHTNEAGTTDQQNVALRGAAARLRAQIYEPDTQMIWEHIKGLADWGPPYSVNGFVDLSVDALMLWLLTRAHASNRA
jgi:hypothetical protein